MATCSTSTAVGSPRRGSRSAAGRAKLLARALAEPDADRDVHPLRWTSQPMRARVDHDDGDEIERRLDEHR